jgi:hypothetical protein
MTLLFRNGLQMLLLAKKKKKERIRQCRYGCRSKGSVVYPTCSASEWLATM